ncbi:NAD(P)/FAD-dependent oxidoreductase [Alisedimentitalea sp. MJ-SS2]|uniref:NAD(P)/FAD-dependent oxidoreductase n=1 Tax=Aliisedimentitalea sp. MJ-SS2 TaxID=3049795 RepID=UPI00290A1504|nr:NAD(P)/FAD-dependent oxidoreductase [Alisedimentitalea sp. MJ-SS2]MDU8929202.1 NAD(P)/FAD-dependent oxidoreductase [Alisedimentitalea sp. MJ-SS2]
MTRNKTLNRREFVVLGTGAAVSTAVTGMPSIARAAGKSVVIIGGGCGGTTAARYIATLDPTIEVTLIEPKKTYHTCFMSNEVIGGVRNINQIAFGYEAIANRGIKVVHDTVTAIDADKKLVMTSEGASIPYERCIVSPGIDFKYEAIPGYSAEAAEIVPHAWKAGPQTALLRKQLEEMPDGGVVSIIAPPNPFRCPPGPYERASLIAQYLKTHKPKSKVLIFDQKETHSKRKLFQQAWERLYGFNTGNAIIEWFPVTLGGGIENLDASTMTLETDLESLEGGVINAIPPQMAGKIAHVAGLVDGDWCPVDKTTFESKIHKGIHVVGDAANATTMPKSGYAANSQAKVAAYAVVELINDRDPEEVPFMNVCYSLAGSDYGFTVAAIYQHNKEKDVLQGIEGSGGLTPMDASPLYLKREADYAHSWYNNMTNEMFG